MITFFYSLLLSALGATRLGSSPPFHIIIIGVFYFFCNKKMYIIHTFFKSKNASISATFDNLARLLHATENKKTIKTRRNDRSAYGTVYKLTLRSSRKTQTTFNPHIDRRSKNARTHSTPYMTIGAGETYRRGTLETARILRLSLLSRNNARHNTRTHVIIREDR